MITTINQHKNKKILKKNLLLLKENLQKQNKTLFNLFLKPNDDLIKLIDLVIKNNISINEFKVKEVHILKHKKKVFEAFNLIKKEKKK
jgi:hypothetical protein